MKFNILIFILFISCTNQKDKSNKQIVNISLSSEMTTIDPANCYDTVCSHVVDQIYETLFEYDYLKRPYSLRPLLAENNPVVENEGTKFTFKIKKNILYHAHPSLPKGRHVTAQDFVTGIKRLAFTKTQSQGWWLFENRIKGLDSWRTKTGNDFNKFFEGPIEGLNAPDESTLIIELNKPFPQLMYALAMGFTAPIPQEVVKAHNNDLSKNSVGTGAFSLSTYKPTQEIILKKFNHYTTSTYPTLGDRYANENKLLADQSKALPLLDEVHFHIMKEQQTTWLNFLSEKIDFFVLSNSKDYFQVALTPDGQLTDELVKKGVHLQIAPTLMYWWLAFNMKDPILGKNLKLREAIAHGVNAEKFIKLFTNNVGLKANSIFPPGVSGYDPSAELPYSYDLEKAKQLMKEAGYPEGRKLPEITFDVRGNSTLNRQIAEFIQQELNQIGIKIKISMLPFPQFLEKSRKGELQFWHGGWVLDYPDAENIIQLLTSENLPPGPNSSFYQNPKVDSAFKKLRYLEETAEKFELMKTVENEVHQDLPWIMLYYSRTYVLNHKHIVNFRYSDIIHNYLKYIKIAQ